MAPSPAGPLKSLLYTRECVASGGIGLTYVSKNVIGQQHSQPVVQKGKGEGEKIYPLVCSVEYSFYFAGPQMIVFSAPRNDQM